MREEGHSTGSLFLAFILGGIIGAGIALLTAPRSGEETRKKIKEFSDELLEKARQTLESGKEFVTDKKSAIKSALEAAKEAYEKELERLSKEHK
jgi:gas vesicle protein